jgi:hypothetical protein
MPTKTDKEVKERRECVQGVNTAIYAKCDSDGTEKCDIVMNCKKFDQKLFKNENPTADEKAIIRCAKQYVGKTKHYQEMFNKCPAVKLSDSQKARKAVAEKEKKDKIEKVRAIENAKKVAVVKAATVKAVAAKPRGSTRKTKKSTTKKTKKSTTRKSKKTKQGSRKGMFSSLKRLSPSTKTKKI